MHGLWGANHKEHAEFKIQKKGQTVKRGVHRGGADPFLRRVTVM
jgi:hypothetical protein